MKSHDASTLVRKKNIFFLQIEAESLMPSKKCAGNH